MRCPNCFYSEYDGNKCSKCGFSESQDKFKGAGLPYMTCFQNRYLAGRILGKGGFGITYKVFDKKDETIRAIKEYFPREICIRDEDGIHVKPKSEEMKLRFQSGMDDFLKEAEILRSLNGIRWKNETITTEMFQSFSEYGTSCFVMEHLTGETLNHYVGQNRSQIDSSEITRIIIRAGRELQKIHEQRKVIHRDVSPENIFLTSDGKVKLIDFGSAKEIDSDSADREIHIKTKFAAPEQYSRNSRQGGGVDVYSLAATYYYLLTGSYLPAAKERWEGATYISLKNIETIHVSAKISEAVDAALRLDPDKRLQTMREFIDVLELEQSEKIEPEKEKVKPPPAPLPIKYRRVAKMEMLSGPMMGMKWSFPKEKRSLCVGRERGKNNVVLSKCKWVSSRHCQIAYYDEERKFGIRDLSSTNGTYIGTKKIPPEKWIFVSNPAEISLAGSYRMRLYVENVQEM